MSVYINGIGAITPQGFYPSDDFLGEMKVYPPGRMIAVEPEYKQFIKPVPLRRMSKFIKMGLASALMCLKDAKIEKPDAIITATGLGAVEDTDKFLDNLTDDNENLLNPTPFIQSTHNAVAARVAIETGCREYNMTYVHKNSAFEQALLDAFLKINNGEYKDILLGGIEEITPTNYELKKNVEFWKEDVGNGDLLSNRNTKGTIAGEGAVFFSLSPEKTGNCYAEVVATKTFYGINGSLNETVRDFLDSAGFIPGDIDMVLTGLNCNVEEDFIYENTVNRIIKNTPQGWYKHLCGEYETSSSFAVMLAAMILKNGNVPDFVMLNGNTVGNPEKILIYQQRHNKNHSFTILKKC